MTNNNNNMSGGFLFGLLTIVFIVLKLIHVVSWSWWWVLAPTWIPFAVVAILLLIIGFITYITK